MEGLRIKKPENTLENRLKMQEKRQQELEERHKKHAKTLRNIHEGKYRNNNNNNSNNNYSNVEELNISRWTVIPSKNEEGGKFFEVPMTPNPSPPSNTPPVIKRSNKTIRKFTNINYEENIKIPVLKRKNKRTIKKQKVGGKRRVQRKTYRRHK